MTEEDSSPPESFSHLGLDADSLRAVRSAGFTTPTPVQIAAIPAVLAGRDVRARAQTGSGKTAAFGLPLLQRLREQARLRHALAAFDDPRELRNHAKVLVLAPTRELAMQISDALTAFAQALPVRLKVLAVYGGVSINPQMLALRGGADVLVATPGRLLDLHRQGAVRLEQTGALVLDEADRMLSLGFADELAEVFSLLPAQRQTLLFSATFPETLDAVMQTTLRDPVEIETAPAAEPQIEQRVYTVDEPRKAALLVQLIQQAELQQVLVFVSVKRTGDALAAQLHRTGLSAAVFHGDKSQSERNRVLSEFRKGTLRVLIATDLAARGIDIEDLPTVVNFELPRSPNEYLHRIGRTGRAGKVGIALSLICPAEYQHFRVIEKRMKMRLPREQVAGFEVSEHSLRG
jgi:superfamily II DNA/RNA helicase